MKFLKRFLYLIIGWALLFTFLEGFFVVQDIPLWKQLLLVTCLGVSIPILSTPLRKSDEDD